MHNPAYNIQSYPPPMTNKTPDSPVYMERTYNNDGRGNQLSPPPYMTPRSIHTLTSPSTETLSPKTIKSLVMCLCVGVMVCGVLVLLSLSLTIYALSGRMGDLENTNRQLAGQLQEQSDQLGSVLVGNTSTKIIQELNASVAELRSKVNLSVSPFSNCSQERTTCSIGAMGGTLADGYHFQCYPPQQSMYKEVRLAYTLLYFFFDWGGGGREIFLSLICQSNPTNNSVKATLVSGNY